MRRIFEILFISCLVSTYSQGQDFSKTMEEIDKIKSAYKSTAYLSYQMKYLYSKQSAPTKYLDSLTGDCKVHDSSFYGKIAKMEFVQNAMVNVVIYTQDKLITVNSPVKKEDRIMPLASWDSVFVAFSMDTTLLSTKGNTRTMEFIFSPNSNYKSFLIQYDTKTYLLKKIVMTTKQGAVDNGPGKITQDGDIVTVLFSNYSMTGFSPSVFSTDKYVRLERGEVIATPGYAGFRLIDARPKP